MLNTTLLLIFGNLGGGEIFIIAMIVLLLFGAKRIPDLMKGLGKGIKEFKDASKDVRDNIEKSMNE